LSVDRHANHLEELRRLAGRYAIPFDLLDRLTLRPREVAHATGLSLRLIEDLIAKGNLPARKVRGVVVVPVLSLLRFLEDQPSAARGRLPNEDAPLTVRARALIDGAPRS
jgi:hypothetical protein